MNDDDPRVFLPDRSREPIPALTATWLLVAALVTGLVFVLRGELSAAAIGVNAALVLLVGAYLALLRWWLRGMRYVVERDRILLRFGPVTYRVPRARIRSVRVVSPRRRRLLNSNSWPGLAVFGVVFRDIGSVTMCATRVDRFVLLELDDGRRYGITPAQEQSLLGALQDRSSSPAT